MTTILNFDNFHKSACSKGMSFNYDYNHPTSLSLYDLKMQVRDAQDNLVVELTDDNSRLSLDSAGTILAMSISSTTTADFNPGIYVYDLIITEIADTTNKEKILKGLFVVEDSVTNDT